MNAPTAELDPATSPLRDEEVIARVQAGERAAFEILVRRHNQRLYRVVRSVLGDQAEVEDVMQAAHVAAFTHLGQFAGRARYATWLCRIGLHEALRRLRHQRREHLTPGADPHGEREPGAHRPGAASPGAPTMDDRPTSARGPEEQLMARQLAGLLEGAIDQLPPPYRLVFVLRQAEELSTAETAELLDLSEEAVKVRLHRARARLRATLFERVGAATAGEVFAFYRPRCDRVVAGVMGSIEGAGPGRE